MNLRGQKLLVDQPKNWCGVSHRGIGRLGSIPGGGPPILWGCSSIA